MQSRWGSASNRLVSEFSDSVLAVFVWDMNFGGQLKEEHLPSMSKQVFVSSSSVQVVFAQWILSAPSLMIHPSGAC